MLFSTMKRMLLRGQLAPIFVRAGTGAGQTSRSASIGNGALDMSVLLLEAFFKKCVTSRRAAPPATPRPGNTLQDSIQGYVRPLVELPVEVKFCMVRNFIFLF